MKVTIVYVNVFYEKVALFLRFFSSFSHLVI